MGIGVDLLPADGPVQYVVVWYGASMLYYGMLQAWCSMVWSGMAWMVWLTWYSIGLTFLCSRWIASGFWIAVTRPAGLDHRGLDRRIGRGACDPFMTRRV